MSFRIAHISDIHIRGLQRHADYRAAFDEFYDKCKDLRIDAIFVGGDIWHTKTQGITPEAVGLITSVFRGMADIAPVYVTLGNHDGILSNSSRLDAISPILEAIGENTRHPIRLFKRSGVYDMHNGFKLGVFSCFDEEGWANVKPVPGFINIAAFHGGISGCLLDSDMEYEADTTLDMFNGFDIALLGDIHRMQFLAYRDVKIDINPNDMHAYPASEVVGTRGENVTIQTQMPWVGYSGSFLQQNFGEPLPKGFLVWDIQSEGHRVWFEEIRTPDPYITIKWNTDVATTLQTCNLVRGCRIRMSCDSSCTPQDERQVHSELKLLFDIREFIVKRDKRDTAILVSDVISEDLHSHETHVKLIKEVVKDYHTPEEWDSAKDIICKALGDAGSKVDDARGVTWSIKSLSFDNVFTYASDNSIDFSNMRGVTGIFGPNRIGKSSIIGAMVYCMFNTTDRGAMKNIHLIRTGQQSCKAKMSIAVSDRDIEIERTSSIKHEKNGRVWAPTTLTLTDSNDNASGEQRSDTEKVIRRTIGTAEDYFMTALSAQGTMNRFIDEGATSRKTYLGRFLDLDVFDRVLEAIKPDANAIKARLKAMPDRDWDAIINESKADAVKISSEIEAINVRVADLHKERSSIQKKIVHCNSGTSIVTEVDVARLAAIVSKRKRSHDDEVTRSGSLQERIDALDKKISAIESLKSTVDIEGLRSQLKTQRELEKKITDLSTSLKISKSELLAASGNVAVLTQIPCGDSFPTCKFIKRSFEDREKVPKIESVVSDAESALKSSQDALRLIAGLALEEKISSYTTALARESDFRSSLKTTRDDLTSSESAIQQCKSSWEDATKDHESAIKKSQEEGSVEIQKLKADLDQSNSDIDALGLDRGNKQSQLSKKQAEISSLIAGQAEYKELRGKWKIYETLLSSYSKKGLPSQILDKLLPAINAEISEILSGVVSFDVQLEIDAETNSLEIYIDYGDSRRIIELGSGMEKMIASLAIRVALTQITSLPKPDFIVIDEGFGSLDGSQLTSCINMIKSLKRIYRFILVISHVDAVKDAVDQVIEIDRINGTSRVVA